MSEQIHAIYANGLWWVWDRTTFTFRLIDTDGETAFALAAEVVYAADWHFTRDYLNRKYRSLRIPDDLEKIQLGG